MNLNEPETTFVFLLTDLTQTQKQASIIFFRHVPNWDWAGVGVGVFEV